MKLWPNQQRALDALDAEEASGVRSVCVTAPTGGGKTVLMGERSRRAIEKGRRVMLLTNRKMLTTQGSRTLHRLGLDHGVYAAGWDASILKDIQVVSMQTLMARIRLKKADYPPADELLIDEPHSCKGPASMKIIQHYIKGGAFVSGYTATPIGLNYFEKLIVAGTKAELRAQGKLVPCNVFAPDEPDLGGVKRTRKDVTSEQGATRRLWSTLVFGNIFTNWKRINPRGLPTIVWAPGVKESRWVATEFIKMGVRAEHIDGSTSSDERQQIFQDNEIGHVPVITSQGVLREGVDLPWLYHGILLQSCIYLSTYLQIVGRLLRAYDGKTGCVLQDHAGAWWRHGSPNADHTFKLGQTDSQLLNEREERFEADEEREPLRCRECGGIRSYRLEEKCPHCGHVSRVSVRAIRMTDGRLVEVRGKAHKTRSREKSAQDKWMTALFACGNAKRPMTVAQAMAFFKKKYGINLPPGTRHVPRENSTDWSRHVHQVYPWTKRKAKTSAKTPQPTDLYSGTSESTSPESTKSAAEPAANA